MNNEGRDSQRGMRDLIKCVYGISFDIEKRFNLCFRDMKLDIVGLLETDLHRTAFGHRDL